MLPLLPVIVVIILPLAFTLWTRWNRWQEALQHARGRLKRMLTVSILVARRRYRRRFLLATGGAVLVALLIIVVSWLGWQWRELVAPPLWSLPLLLLLWAGTLCLGESYVHYRLWHLADLWLFEREHTTQAEPSRHRLVRRDRQRRRSEFGQGQDGGARDTRSD